MQGMATTLLFLLGVIQAFAQITPPCQPPTAYTTLEVNNVRAGLLNGGDLWWDLNDAKYEVPKGSGTHSLFSGGFWIGGIDAGGKLKIAAQTYRQYGTEYWAGPLGIPDAATYSVCRSYDRFWRVNQLEIDQFDQLRQQYLSSGDSIPLGQIPQSIQEWPASGNPYAKGLNSADLEIPVSKDLAPYIDVDGNPGYDPTKGDYPEIRGEETVWWVFNAVWNLQAPSSDPLEVEVRAMAYALSSPAYLQETTFYKFEVTNYGSDLDSTYLGLQVDVDLGWAFDDFVGCDTARDMGIGYNGDAIDGPGAAAYGSNPPFVGIDFLRTPYASGNVPLGMTSFMAYDNDFSNNGNPTGSDHFYHYLQARLLDGTPLTHNGKVVKYMFPSEPNASGEWSECEDTSAPYDRRFVMGSGPFNLDTGETVTFDFEAIWNRCFPTGACPPFDCIQAVSDSVQDWFDAVYPPVGLPKVLSQEQNGLILYPNPTSSAFVIGLTNPVTSATQITIFDVRGKEVFRKKVDPGQDRLELSVETWSVGIYFIQATGSNGEVRGGKLVVNR